MNLLFEITQIPNELCHRFEVAKAEYERRAHFRAKRRAKELSRVNWFERLPPKTTQPQPSSINGVLAGVGLVAAGVTTALAAVVWWRRRKTRKAASLGYGELIVEAEGYRASSREAMDGEVHDFVDVETVPEEQSSDVAPECALAGNDGPPGLSCPSCCRSRVTASSRKGSSHTGATRRILVRKKV
jgi:hypothetical protein